MLKADVGGARGTSSDLGVALVLGAALPCLLVDLDEVPLDYIKRCISKEVCLGELPRGRCVV
jgi:hypothetical protein